MKRLIWLLALLLLAPVQGRGAGVVFEKADALYRPKRGLFLAQSVTGFLFGHAGMYLNSGASYRFTRAQAEAEALPDLVASDGAHSVIQSPGYFQGGVQIVSFANFLGSLPYWGAYERPDMPAQLRQIAIWEVGKRLEADYTLLKGWNGTSGKFRCDGLIAFAYAHPRINRAIPENPGGWLTNFPRTQRSKLKALNGGMAGGRPPACRAATRTPSGSNFILSASQVRDDAAGSGIDRVDFYNGQPGAGGTLIGSDDHDSNPDAGLTASDTYAITSAADPGTNLFMRIHDQAGNSTLCAGDGTLISKSDEVQTSPNIVEDVNPPVLANLEVKQEPGGQTAKATWTPSDDQTPAASLNYIYAIDKAVDDWDDTDVTFLGQVATPEIQGS